MVWSALAQQATGGMPVCFPSCDLGLASRKGMLPGGSAVASGQAAHPQRRLGRSCCPAGRSRSHSPAGEGALLLTPVPGGPHLEPQGPLWHSQLLATSMEMTQDQAQEGLGPKGTEAGVTTPRAEEHPRGGAREDACALRGQHSLIPEAGDLCGGENTCSPG